MNFDDLIDKFDSLQDLPVSEEMIGAYLEENLTPSELFDVKSTIESNSDLSEIVDSISNDNLDTFSDFSNESYINDYQLPTLPSDDFIELDLQFHSSNFETDDYDDVAVCALTDEDLSDGNHYFDSNTDNPFEEDEISYDSSDNNDNSDYE